jgi:SAM-dependent methyltransferase
VDDHALSFGPAAHIYERGRPPYPEEALDWLLPPGAPRVLDLGAGTGKLTRQIAARGLEVTAVDPSDGMLAQLRRVLPSVPALIGSAEEIPLPDGSVDVVLVAQAWHWADPVRAAPEIARVLSPGGRLGLLWNIRDEGEDWVRRLGEILDGGEQARSTHVGPPFGPVEHRRVRWEHRISPDSLLDLVASRSYVIVLPAAERAELLAAVADVLDTHPALRGAERVRVPYLTRCSRFARD